MIATWNPGMNIIAGCDRKGSMDQYGMMGLIQVRWILPNA
jgi:hypothetical protein